MQMWTRMWRVNFRTGIIKSYLVDFQTKQVNDPERMKELADREWIKCGFISDKKAKEFYAKYKNYYNERIATMATAGAGGS